MRKKVLVVCMLDSIHTARWLAQFQQDAIEFLIFPSSPNRRVHKNLEVLLQNTSKAKYRLVPMARYWGLPLWLLDKLLDNSLRGFLLNRIAKKFKPEIVHALELQNAGYISLKAFSRAQRNFKLIATNWGSDIYWFQQFPKHKQKLKELLSLAECYSCECQRDVHLAQALGFAGKVLPVFPNAGGFNTEQLQGKVPLLAERKQIAIKGYQGWVGRAHVALEAVRKISGELRNYKIVVYSANLSTIRLAKRVAKQTELSIEVFGKGQLSHSQVIEMFSNSKLYVGLSMSDGISTSLLESMAMGSIPVQTSSACCDEWFSTTGVKVEEISAEKVAQAMLEGLRLADNQANSDFNRQAIREKASAEDIQKLAKTFYFD